MQTWILKNKPIKQIDVYTVFVKESDTSLWQSEKKYFFNYSKQTDVAIENKNMV